MANCAICTEFDNCPWRSDPDAMCSAFAQKPMTNGDKIRSMTDEELAEWIYPIADCFCPSKCIHNGVSCTLDEESCKKAWLDWLKEEVSE